MGLGYFVKYAIDKDWINEYGRVAIGILAGGALIFVAHNLRKSYKTFASILTGGGLAVLYFTIAIAFHQYHLFSQSSAFAIMILITIFSVALSLVYDKKELAIFSLLGGYAAPFMVSTGEGNYVVLFTYILILNAGLIVLAYYKRWYLLNILAYIITLILFGSWVFSGFKQNGQPAYSSALIFSTLFYIAFFLVNVINNLKERKPFTALEIGMILSNNLFYLLAGLFILSNLQNGMYRGLFTALIGVYNFCWILYLYKKSQIDKVFIYLLVGLVMSLISLAVPIQLKGHPITLFWSAEIVVLLWISQKSGFKVLKTGHLLIMVLTGISLVMDWDRFYSQSSELLPVLINKCFITGIVVFCALFLASLLLRNEKEKDFIAEIPVSYYRSLLYFIMSIQLYLVLFLELQYQLNQYYHVDAFRETVYAVFNSAFVGTLMLIAYFKKREKALRRLSFLAMFFIIIYIAFYYSQILSVRYLYLAKYNVSYLNYLFHFLAYPFLAIIIILIGVNRKNLLTDVNNFHRFVLWLLSFFVIFIVSAETDNIILIANHASLDNISGILHLIHKVGYPILWGFLAFVMMVWGMKVKNKDFRIISLTVFTLIILKIYIIDIWDMSKGGRIAALIFLGLVLLLVSFLYQRFKKFLVDSNEEEKNEN